MVEEMKGLKSLEKRRDVTITFQEPLDRETIDQLIEQFDGGNIYPRDGHGWWGTATEEDKPSYKDNIAKESDGTIHLRGIDFTEGRIRTHLGISGDAKSVNVDLAHNYDVVRTALDKKGIEYQIKKPL